MSPSSVTSPNTAQSGANEVTENCLSEEEVRIRRNQEADAAWKHYQDTGLHITGEEAIAWIRSWGTTNELPMPKPHGGK